jgi:glycosyltransferase involved in cell wall biosynthesis
MILRRPLEGLPWGLFLKTLVYGLVPESILPGLRQVKRRMILLMKNVNYALFCMKNIRIKPCQTRTNVLFIVPHMTAGGGDRTNLNIAGGVNRSNFCFHIFKTEVKGYEEWRDRFQKIFRNIIVPSRADILWDKYILFLIRKLNIRILVTCNSWICYQQLPRIRAECGDIKIIDLLHAEESVGALPQFDWLPPFLDRRICISNRLKEYMVKRCASSGFGVQYADKIKVIYNGIDLAGYESDGNAKGQFRSMYSIPEEAKIISYVGRFSPEKNPCLFIEIARRVVQKSAQKVTFVMAGDGPDREEVQDLVRQYELSDHIILTGTIDAVSQLLADSHLVVVVSKSEGIPYVVLESMAMGVPVISTDVGAIREVLEQGTHGYIIPSEGDVVDLFVDRILNLLSSESTYDDIVRVSKKDAVAKYSVGVMGRHYERVFQEAIAE